MDLFVIQYTKRNGDVVYYTKDTKTSQNTFFGSNKIEFATFYKQLKAAEKIRKTEVERIKSAIADSKDYDKKKNWNKKFLEECKKINTVSIERIELVEKGAVYIDFIE